MIQTRAAVRALAATLAIAIVVPLAADRASASSPPSYAEIVAKPKAYIGQTVALPGKSMGSSISTDASGKIVSETMTFLRVDAAQKIVVGGPFIVEGKWTNSQAAETAYRTPGDPFIRMVRGKFVRLGEVSFTEGGVNKTYPAPVLRDASFDMLPKP